MRGFAAANHVPLLKTRRKLSQTLANLVRELVRTRCELSQTLANSRKLSQTSRTSRTSRTLANLRKPVANLRKLVANLRKPIRKLAKTCRKLAQTRRKSAHGTLHERRRGRKGGERSKTRTGGRVIYREREPPLRGVFLTA